MVGKMKIFIKSLRGDREQIQVESTDTVRSLKQKIQQLQGHSPDMQKLILTGKILQDAKVLQEYSIQQGATLVIMVTKPKPGPRPAQPPAAPIQLSPAQPSPVQPSPVQRSDPSIQEPSEPRTFFQQHASTLVTGQQLEQTISSIAEMGFPPDQVVAAMRAAYNNPDRAIEYLMTGIPQQPEIAEPQQRPQGGNLQNNPLAFLLQNPEFLQLRARIQENPQILVTLLPQIQQSNPELAQMILQNQDAFMQLIQEPVPQIDPRLIQGLPVPPGSQGAPQQGGQMPVQERRVVQLTQEQAQSVRRLAELGFHPQDALEAYMSCDKNEEIAANLLFENYQPIAMQLEQEQLGNQPIENPEIPPQEDQQDPPQQEQQENPPQEFLPPGPPQDPPNNEGDPEQQMLRILRSFAYRPKQVPFRDWKIVIGDKVEVITGRDKGKQGNVVKVFRKTNKVIVGDVNLYVKHIKPSGTKPIGQKILKEAPIHISNVALIDPETQKPTKVRFGYTEEGKKVRVSKKSGALIAKPEYPEKQYASRYMGKENGIKDTEYNVAYEQTYFGEDYEAIREEFQKYIEQKEIEASWLVFPE